MKKLLQQLNPILKKPPLAEVDESESKQAIFFSAKPSPSNDF